MRDLHPPGTFAHSLTTDIVVYRSDWETAFLVCFHQNVWTTRQSIYSHRNFQPSPKSPSLQEPILRCKQVENNWEQIRCVAHSPLICGMTIPLLNLIGAFIAWTQCVRIHFACTKRLVNLSQEAFIFDASSYVRRAIWPLTIKQIRFCWSLAKGFISLKRRKNQFKMLLEMCIVQHIQTKNVFTFQPTKLLVSMIVKKCKSYSNVLRFLLWTKNRKLRCLVVMVHIVLREKRVVTTKKRKHLHFWTILSPITIKNTRTWTKEGKNHSTYGIIVSNPHWLTQLTKSSIPFSFLTLSVYSEVTWLSQSPLTVLSGNSTLDQIKLLWL